MSRIDLLLELLNSRVEKDWCDTLFSLSRSHGFDQALIGIVPNKKAPLENAFLRSNYPSRWLDTYKFEKLHYVDPIVSHCLGSAIPLVWSPETFGTPRQKQFYEEACGHGIRSGVTFPMHGANGEFGVISFVSDALSSKKSQRALHHLMPDLALLRDYALESSLRFANASDDKKKKVRLTKRELECLKWIMEGKSSRETSRIINRSEATVNFHINNILHKLSVGTRQQALVKAVYLGLITPVW